VFCNIQGVPEKIAQSLSTTILQPQSYAIFSKMFRKKNVFTIKASVWIRQLYILRYSAGKWTTWKQGSRVGTWWHITFCFQIGIYAIVLAVRRHLRGKIFTREPTSSTTPRHTFLQTLACIQSFQFVCCCQGLNFTPSEHFELQIILGIY